MSPIATVNGTTLHHEVAGSGDPVVLVHGFSFDARMWDGQVDALAERYTVARYDLRGFGQSSTPAAGVHYRHADDLWALVDHLGFERVALVGLSVGGAVVLDAARVQPERVRALVVIDGVLPGFDMAAAMAGNAPVWRTARSGDIETAKQLWLENAMFAPAMERPHAAELLRRMVADYSGWGWAERDPGTWVDPPSADDLASITAPTLVLVGDRDLPDFQRAAETMERGIPNARRVVLPGLGHLPPMEDPEVVNEVVLGFLAEIAIR